MKKTILTALLGLSIAATAQTPWTGTLLTGTSYRTGNVGIGLSSPTTLLDVNGGFSHFTHNTASLPPSDPFGGLSLGWNRIGAEVDFYNVYEGAPTSFLFSQKTGASTMVDLMVIKGNGNVGIGTNTPEKRLHVWSYGDANFRLQGSGTTNSQKWDLVSSAGSGILNSGYFGIVDVNDNASRLVIDNDGRVGLGLNIPETQLHVLSVGDARLRLQGSVGANSQKWDLLSSGGSFMNSGYFGIVDVDANAARMTINNIGNVGIGVVDAGNFNLSVLGQTKIGVKSSTAHSNAMLMVDGKVVCKDLYVTASSDWPDFVFDANYKLANLYDVRNYYQTYKHLPNVPSACEIEEKGISMSEMSAIQMQKIEELTLYIIQLKEELDALKKQVLTDRH